MNVSVFGDIPEEEMITVIADRRPRAEAIRQSSHQSGQIVTDNADVDVTALSDLAPDPPVESHPS
ncbi:MULTISPECIES: hypothetical protein [unclassified Microbacterium]|uniref:hypothetical protein n=1 Tax=unclassified Microbacterium TaxID=2609290 RepID=UPI0031391E53